jgi:hypothetical protein
MPRFVILRHDCPPGYNRGLHWDFMLEMGDVLRTWALAESPVTAIAIAAAALPDHRLAYLDFEGPLSGDRGSVARWDQGSYELVSRQDDEWIVELFGERLIGRATLRRSPAAAPSWSWHFVPVPAE